MSALGSPKNRKFILSLLCLIGLYGALNFPHLDRPGLYGDEAVEPMKALSIRQGRIPLEAGFLTLPYHGGMKVFVHWAALAVFPPGVVELRAVNLAVGFLAVLLTLILGRQLLGEAGGFFSAACLAVDPNFFINNRGDYSGATFGIVFGAGAAICLLHCLRTANRWSGLGAGVLFGLMMWNYVLVLIPVLAILLASTAVYCLREKLFSSPRYALLCLAGCLFGMSPLMRGVVQDHFRLLALAFDPTFQNSATTKWGLALPLKNMLLMAKGFSGWYIQDLVMDGLFPKTYGGHCLLLLGFSCLWLWQMGRRRLGDADAAFQWLGWIVLSSAVLFMGVAAAYGAHHILLVFYPWVPLFVMSGVREISRRAKTAGPAIMVGGGLIALASNLPPTLSLRSHIIGDRVTFGFSRQVSDDLLRFLSASGSRAVFMNWELGRSQHYLSGGALDISDGDPFRPVNKSSPSAADGSELEREFAEHPDALYVLLVRPDWRAMERRNFFDLVSSLGLTAVPVHVISWKEQGPVIDVYKIAQPS